MNGYTFGHAALDRLPPPERPPFIIYALPRSRTAWLSAFLSYGGWTCFHESALAMRSLTDIRAFFRMPRVGSAETAAALGWRVLHHHVPELRAVVVHRPVEEVVASTMRLDLGGVATYDEALLRSVMLRSQRALEQISRQPGVLVVEFTDLDREDACAAVFEHCLPFPFPRARWQELRYENIQRDAKAVILYYQAHRAAIERFKVICKAELRRLARAGAIGSAMEAKCLV